MFFSTTSSLSPTLWRGEDSLTWCREGEGPLPCGMGGRGVPQIVASGGRGPPPFIFICMFSSRGGGGASVHPCTYPSTYIFATCCYATRVFNKTVSNASAVSSIDVRVATPLYEPRDTPVARCWYYATPVGAPQQGGLSKAASLYKGATVAWREWGIALMTGNEQGGFPL